MLRAPQINALQCTWLFLSSAQQFFPLAAVYAGGQARAYHSPGDGAETNIITNECLELGLPIKGG